MWCELNLSATVTFIARSSWQEVRPTDLRPLFSGVIQPKEDPVIYANRTLSAEEIGRVVMESGESQLRPKPVPVIDAQGIKRIPPKPPKSQEYLNGALADAYLQEIMRLKIVAVKLMLPF